MEKLYKKCKLSDNWILVDITQDVADMKLFNIDESNFKLFCKLIVELVDELKLKNIKYMRQMVMLEEYNEFLKNKTTWKIVDKNEVSTSNIVLIECELDKFINNFAQAHGVDFAK